MLRDTNAHTDIATKDIGKARQFYGDKLGLKELKRDEHGCTFYQSGNGTVKLYESNLAGTNRATYMSWDVDNISDAVDELKSKGIKFEHYDMPGVTHEGEVHVIGKERAAWFKDPDGNILCVGSEV
jgi:catechol 2,3-dioxygenase-like lactoylglutathione lyase family enzyme